jgi:hypothetical protein
VTTPDETPVRTPVLELMVALVVGEQDHVPPAVASVNVPVEPMQTEDGPEIAPGVGLTVTAVTEYAAPTIYVNVATPAETP